MYPVFLIKFKFHGKEGNRTPQELLTHHLAGDSTYQCKQSLCSLRYATQSSKRRERRKILILNISFSEDISLYQTRTGTNYSKGSCTTVILKDLLN